jgi:hypothetical protein
LLISASPQTLEQMASGSYSAWDCLNEHYEAQSFENRGHYGLLRLEGTYELKRLGDLYARLPGITAAEPNWLIGDGSTVYVTRVDDEWHYVADAASGDCPAGCTHHVLYYFISEPGGAVRYMDRWTAVPGQTWPRWVEAYWKKRSAPGLSQAPVVMSAPSYSSTAGARSGYGSRNDWGRPGCPRGPRRSSRASAVPS